LKKVIFIIFILFSLENYSYSILKQFNCGLFYYIFSINENNLYHYRNQNNYYYNCFSSLYQKVLINEQKQQPCVYFYNFQYQFPKYNQFHKYIYKENKIKNLNNTNNIQTQEQNIQEQQKQNIQTQEQKEMPKAQVTNPNKQNNQNPKIQLYNIDYDIYLYFLNQRHKKLQQKALCQNNNNTIPPQINLNIDPKNLTIPKNILEIGDFGPMSENQSKKQSQQKFLRQNNNNNTIPPQINLNIDPKNLTIPKDVFFNQNKQLAIAYFGLESQWKKNDIISQNKLQQENKAFFNFNQKKKLQNKNNFLKTIKEEINEQNNDNSDNISEASTRSTGSTRSTSSNSTLSKNNFNNFNNKKNKNNFFAGASINSQNKNYKNNNKNNNVCMRHLTKVKQIGGSTQFTEYIGFNKNEQWINISKQQYNEFMNQQNKIKQN
jgi:hypothetical protein